jgi:hypothetical protein
MLPDGSAIQGTSGYTMGDGTTGVAGDVALAFAPAQPPSSVGGVPIMLSNGSSIDAGVAQLVSAMAARSGRNGSFDALPTVQMPDVNPPPLIAAALHP